MDKPKNWVLIVHGGAKTIQPGRESANRKGCLKAVQAGAEILRNGGSAVRAVEASILVLEDDPTFNAGNGAVHNADDDVEMDAAVMDGHTLDVGAVTCVRNLRNPVSAATAMLKAPPVLLAGRGAERFAEGEGLQFVATAAVCQHPSTDAAHDTVGCVAMDMNGHLAAATSTGGLAGTLPGRVGDSPLPGCGLYADDMVGAVSLSGDGECITRMMLAARIMHALENQSSQSAAQGALEHLHRVNGEAGAIVLDATGRPGIAHNSDHFAIGIAATNIEAVSGLHRDELKELLDV